MILARDYNYLKIHRTYIGNSKKEQSRIFLKAQGIEKGKRNSDNPNVDWLEFRRLVIQNFEDIIHVIYSRKVIVESLSYILLLMSIPLLLLNYNLLFIISFGLSSLLYIFFEYYKRKEIKEAFNYHVVITITNSMIRKEFGLEIPDIE